MKLRQRLARPLCLVGHAEAQPLRDLVQPFVQRGDELHLAAMALLRQALQGAGKFGNAVFEFGGALTRCG